MLAACVFIMLPAAAQAVAIVNVTDKDASFELATSEGWKPFTIPAGGRFFRTGDAQVRFNGREQRIQYDEEYALWPDGTFGPQRKLRFLGARY